jgi:acetylornithine deacetylase/succinyl-diaminopimelate desuccinylase-like protein
MTRTGPLRCSRDLRHLYARSDSLIRACFAACALLMTASPAPAQQVTPPADSALSHEIFRDLIAIRSISETPATVEAAEMLVRRLRAAGFSAEEARVVQATPGTGSVVARLTGRGSAPPVLLMAHLDVVPANRDDWTTDPFQLVEREGWWYGRGTIDNKEAAAHLVTNFVRWRRDGFVPERDLIAVITGDEETTSGAIQWLVRGEGRALAGDPALALNFDAGGGFVYGGRDAMLGVQTSEKIYISYRLTVRNPGGHSSLPRQDNAIYSLTRALTRIAEHRFPVELNETTQLSLERGAAFEESETAALMRAVAADGRDGAADRLSAIPRFNAMLRTTCVATRLSAGHADNALPQTAEAIVNCRLLPGSDTAVVARTLHEVIADPEVRIEALRNATTTAASPWDPSLVGPIEDVARRFWPGVVVVPRMSTGATDGAYVRNAGIPVYGVSGIFSDPDESRAHGRDERIEIRRYYEGLEFQKALVERLTTAR